MYIQISSMLPLILLLTPSTLASITCFKPGTFATAQWTNSLGKRCEWKGTVGSNFGVNVVNGGVYVVFLLFSVFPVLGFWMG